MKYNTLLFDVDDTLLDFQQTEANALSALFAEARDHIDTRNQNEL